MTTVLIIVGAGVAGFLGILWLSHRTLVNAPPGGGSSSNAFGGMDVFDPGQARAKDDLREHDTKTVVAPTHDDEDDPVRLLTDGAGNPRTIRLRRDPLPRDQ